MKKRVLLKDIAERSGLTVNTVSRALKNKSDIAPSTREYIQALALEMGYIPDIVAASLRQGYTNTIGVMFDNISNPYYMIMAEHLNNLTIAEGNTYFSVEEGTLYNLDKTNIIAVLPGWHYENYVIKSSVTKIVNNAFAHCPYIKAITYEESSNLTSIGHQAFNQCKSLTSITLPNTLNEIEWGAFESCINLTEITIPTGITKISYGLLRYCESLKKVTFLGNIQEISEYAFENCVALDYIIIPSTVVKIGDYAFDDCNNLTIFAEADQKPEAWNENWNYSNRPVYWAGEWHLENGIPVPNNP